MRVRHVMNKHSSENEQSEQTATQSAGLSDIDADHPSTAFGTPRKEEEVVTLMDIADEGTPTLEPKEEDLDEPESWTGEESKEQLEQVIQDTYHALLHSPERWYSLNKRLNKKGGRFILFQVEDLIKDKGLAPVREEFLKVKDNVTADLIWSLHQPLLSLMLFILRENNDIHKKLIKVPDLKSDICRAMGLGRPSKKPPSTPKPKLERKVKKIRVTLAGKRIKTKKLLSLGLKRKRSEDSGAGPSPADEDTKKPPARYKSAKPRASSDPPPAKKLKAVQGNQTLHQLIASSQERDRSGKFAPGFSPAAAVKLKKVIKKPLAITKPGHTKLGGTKPGVTKSGATKPGGTKLGGTKAVGLKLKLTREGAAPKTKLSLGASTPKKKQPTPKRSRLSISELALLPDLPDEDLAYEPRPTDGDSLEDEEIAALVAALRARGAREARGREEMAVLEIDEKISDLEVAQRRGEADLAKLRARRGVLLGERLGKAGEPEVSEPVKAARERCLRAIVDLLDVLPANLDLNAVDVFNELERTDAFDATLGALGSKHRAYLQREWDRKNALAAQAKRAEAEAMRQKNNVRQHLGILAASSADEEAESEAVFGAFQLKLIELRQEMERKADLLAEKEKLARQAWLVYRAAA